MAKTTKKTSTKKTTTAPRKYRDDQIELMKKRGYWPIPELAAKCMVAPCTVYRWIDAEKIEGIQVGNARYVSLASLKTYLGPDACKTFGL